MNALPVNVNEYLERKDSILPCFRAKALWECTDTLRRLWDERYYATEDGEALLLGAYYRYCAAEQLAKGGKRLVGDMG